MSCRGGGKRRRWRMGNGDAPGEPVDRLHWRLSHPAVGGPMEPGGRPEGCRLSPTKPRRSTVPAGSPSSPSSPSQLPTSHPPTSHASFDAGGLLVWTGLWRSQNGGPKGLSSPTSTPDPASRSVFLCSSDYIPIKDQRPFNWSDPPLIGTRPLSYLPSHRPLASWVSLR